eukprot:gene38212-46431_t
MGNIPSSCACAEQENAAFSNFVDTTSPSDNNKNYSLFSQTNPLSYRKALKPSSGLSEEDISANRSSSDDSEDRNSADESVMTLVSPTKDRSTKSIKPPLGPHSLVLTSNLKEGDSLEEEQQSTVYLKPHDEVFKAVVIGSVQQLEEILLRRNIKPSQVTGYTILHLAVIEERVDMIEYSLTHGVNVCSKDKLGRTALHLCYMSTNIKVLDTLINFLESQDNQPLTPFSPYARSSQRLGSPHSPSEMTSITMTSALVNTDDLHISSDDDGETRARRESTKEAEATSISSVATEERKKKKTALRLVRKAASRMRKALLTHNFSHNT